MWTHESLSKITIPEMNSRKSWQTVDFPEAIPPVSPTSFT